MREGDREDKKAKLLLRLPATLFCKKKNPFMNLTWQPMYKFIENEDQKYWICIHVRKEQELNHVFEQEVVFSNSEDLVILNISHVFNLNFFL